MPNRLGDSSSPYLRQHRDNPVDWHPWSPEAFDEARRRDVPVLLSIGYSACHWCHVMAHESFEDDEVAAVMNRDFVNIKVDREERPDVDAVYMDAVQAMTGRGGWPMTVFLAPDARPFYGGTYFPKTTFLRLLGAITETWNERRGDATANADALMEALRDAGSMPSGGSSGRSTAGTDEEILEGTTASLLARFDPVWGGFGGAPKFPPTFALEHLIRSAVDSGDRSAEDAVLTTLDAIAAGGIHDHIGGGFSRYSVDEKWIVPHFEKMLYDQALINRAYLHSWQAFGVMRHLDVLRHSMQYLLSVLRSPEGGFYCAEDADSLDSAGHSHEGAFYTWTPDEIRTVLGDEADAACALWGIDASGNFEGRSIPVRIHGGPVPEGAEDLRRRLAAARDLRPRPGLDDKILTEWTAMALSTLAEAAGAVGDPSWATAAVGAADFLVSRMRRPDGRWLRVWHREAGGASLLATAHDLAHAVDALTRTYELTGDSSWVARALEAADVLVGHHWDAEDPGFFTVADDGEQLVVRAKDYIDNAVPSANSTAAIALARLGALTGRDDLRAVSDAVMDRLAEVSRRAPTATTNLAIARHLRRGGITEVVISGDRPDLLAEVRSAWRPDVVLAWGDRFDSPLWEGRNDDRAYVCRGYVCMAPAGTVAELRAALDSARPSR